MLKALLGAIAIRFTSHNCIISAQAAEMMDCTEANMTKANADMDKMPAGEKKTMGMTEMTMTKEMMDEKDMTGCKTPMNKAMEMEMSK